MNKSKRYKIYQYLFPDGYIYIGRTCQTIEQRINTGYTTHMKAYLDSLGLPYEALVQYLLDSHVILYDNLTFEEAKRLETELTDAAKLKYGDKCLNLNSGDTPSEETRQKLSEALSGENHPLYGRTCELHPLYGKHLSDEHKQKLSKSHQGLSHSEETKQKISEANSGENHPLYGKHFSDETRQKMSKAHSGEHNQNYTLYIISDGITEFKGDQTQIAEHLHLNPSEFHKVHDWIKPCTGFPQRCFPGLKVISRCKPNTRNTCTL